MKSITFPDKYIVSSIVQDVAFLLGEHALFEGTVGHKRSGHFTSGIRNLETTAMI